MTPIVEPIIISRIARGLLDVVNRAREHAEEHGGFKLEVDRTEFDDATIWIERYVNWSKQFLGKSPDDKEISSWLNPSENQ